MAVVQRPTMVTAASDAGWLVSQTARVQSVTPTTMVANAVADDARAEDGDRVAVIRTSRIWARRFATGLTCSDLRCAVSIPSGGYPSRLRSLTLTARSACPAGSTALPAEVPGRHGRGYVRRHPAASPPCLPRHALRAALVAELASLALAGCRRLRASPRLVAVALRASPVSASPCTAPCNRSPHKCGHFRPPLPAAVLRTTAVQYPRPQCPPLKRRGGSDSAGFAGVDSPIAHTAGFGRSVPPGRPWVSQPDASLMRVRHVRSWPRYAAPRHDRAHANAFLTCRD